MSTHVLLLIAAIGQPAQAPEMPEAWQKKIEAAVKASESHHPVQAEALLTEVVNEAEKFGRDDLRRAQPLELSLCFTWTGNTSNTPKPSVCSAVRWRSV